MERRSIAYRKRKGRGPMLFLLASNDGEPRHRLVISAGARARDVAEASGESRLAPFRHFAPPGPPPCQSRAVEATGRTPRSSAPRRHGPGATRGSDLAATPHCGNDLAGRGAAAMIRPLAAARVETLGMISYRTGNDLDLTTPSSTCTATRRWLGGARSMTATSCSACSPQREPRRIGVGRRAARRGRAEPLRTSRSPRTSRTSRCGARTSARESGASW